MKGLILAVLLCLQQTRVTSSNSSFVWKPTGAHFNQAIIILPRYYTGVVTDVDMLTIDGRKINRAIIKSNGLCTGVPECLFRQTFLAGRSGREFQRRFKSVVVRVNAPGRECRTYLIKRPAQRAQYK